MQILLANPRGFCAGVDRAISIVENALAIYYGAPIYVRHEVVHNRYAWSIACVSVGLSLLSRLAKYRRRDPDFLRTRCFSGGT